MDLSRNWLKEFVDVDVSPKEFDEVMTISGSKVEMTTDLGAEIKGVVVGRVTELHRHEDSDHMWVCTVDVGGASPLQIVTGAQNVSAGDLVPVAMDGSSLPGGKTITAGKLRGVMSEGMLCSLSELGLTLHDYPYAIEDGIFILQEECAPGQDIRPVLGLDDYLVGFEITNNRPDCFSVIGLAREASAAFQKPLRLHDPVVKGSGGDITQLLDVEVEADDLCPRYTARMVKNVKIAPSPKWMRERLRNMGIRPINNIVDITNYVMLEYGQPMHAFDFACVGGGKIIVRRAKDGEKVTTLDGVERDTNPNMLLIADSEKAVGVAGVMGGENSEITENTVNVVFESANFNGVSIRQTAIALGMRTDASGIFEKGLDPMNTLPAVQRACELVELLGAGEVIDGIVDVISSIPEPYSLPLEPEAINRLLGTSISESDMIAYLARLQLKVDGGMISIPSWRPDLRRTADIAEEVGRLYGYNRMETTMFRAETSTGKFTPFQKLKLDAESALRSVGYSEILTYSFVSPSGLDKIRVPADSPLRDYIRILNPLGEDSSVMRTTSLPSMLEVLARNNSFRAKTVRFYEMATVYKPVKDSKLADEPVILTLGAYGADVDFFTMKGELETAMGRLNTDVLSYVACCDNPSYHTGRCADIYCGAEKVGVMGQIHPLAAKNYGISQPVYAVELNFTALSAHIMPEKSYSPLPRFPAVTRDLAIVCDDKLTVAQLEGCISGAAGELLREIKLFDVYKGANIPEGKKSVAFSLTLRADDRTLTDVDAENTVTAVLNALGTQLGAGLR